LEEDFLLKENKISYKTESNCFSPKGKSLGEENLWAVEEQVGRRIPGESRQRKRLSLVETR